MIDALDSRALRRTNCFAQRFMRPGSYGYDVVPPYSAQLSRDRPFRIEAAEKRGTEGMKQHNVQIRRERGRYVATPERLAIEAGDLVLWNCVDKEAVWAVAGDKEFFGSSRLVNECGFTHVFAAAGEYRWADAYGGGARGLVRVTSPDCRDDKQRRAWERRLREGALVMIDGDRADPAEIDVVVGQTVFFAIVKSSGMTITDERLIEIGAAAEASYKDRVRPR